MKNKEIQFQSFDPSWASSISKTINATSNPLTYPDAEFYKQENKTNHIEIRWKINTACKYVKTPKLAPFGP